MERNGEKSSGDEAPWALTCRFAAGRVRVAADHKRRAVHAWPRGLPRQREAIDRPKQGGQRCRPDLANVSTETRDIRAIDLDTKTLL
jgi:hypothetical protein